MRRAWLALGAGVLGAVGVVMFAPGGAPGPAGERVTGGENRVGSFDAEPGPKGKDPDDKSHTGEEPSPESSGPSASATRCADDADCKSQPRARAPATKCTLPSSAARRTVRVHPGLAYTQVRGRPLHLDLALPPQDGAEPPYPAVVLIHGGGWRAGERAHMHKEMRTLAARGFAAASLDYRLVEGTKRAYPGAVSDVRCAVRWLRHHAERWAIDGGRIAAVGTSAGGHLAALLATAPEVSALDEGCAVDDVSPAVQAAVAYFAPFDLRAGAAAHPGTARVVGRFLGARPKKNPARATQASPIVHIDGSDPPMLLVHGTADPTVPVAQSRKMRAALRDAGVLVRYVEIPGAGHGFPLLSRRTPLRPATCSTLDFLEDVLAHGS